jgi:rhodanese-related sulfurtransferase
MISHRSIDRDEVLRLVRDERAQLVEVLPKSAFEAVHLPGAVSIPLGDIDDEGARDLDRSRPIVVYCYDDK